MAISRRKSTLVHVSLLLLILIIGLLLLVMPFDVGGKTPSSTHRSPLEIRNHEPNADRSYENSQQIRRIQESERRLDDAQRDVYRAQQDVYNARIPSTINQTSRYYNIIGSESALDAAKNEERMRSNDLYMEKRILESNQREQRLQRQRNDWRYRSLQRP